LAFGRDILRVKAGLKTRLYEQREYQCGGDVQADEVEADLPPSRKASADHRDGPRSRTV
jgi:hypothetical protein